MIHITEASPVMDMGGGCQDLTQESTPLCQDTPARTRFSTTCIIIIKVLQDLTKRRLPGGGTQHRLRVRGAVLSNAMSSYSSIKWAEVVLHNQAPTYQQL